MKSKPTGDTPLSPSAEALLKHERVLPPQPESTRARMLSRAREAINQGPPALPSPRGALDQGSRALLGGVAALAVAGAVAGGWYLLSGPEPAPVPGAAPPSTSLAPPAATPAEVPPATSAAVLPPAAAPTATTPQGPDNAAPVPRVSSSAARENGPEEVQLLVRARQANARGDYGAVLAIADEHERTYPAGRLTEEREVLRVKALVALGRLDQARRVGARFHRRFPRSVLLRKVDEMLASPP